MRNLSSVTGRFVERQDPTNLLHKGFRRRLAPWGCAASTVSFVAPRPKAALQGDWKRFSAPNLRGASRIFGRPCRCVDVDPKKLRLFSDEGARSPGALRSPGPSFRDLSNSKTTYRTTAMLKERSFVGHAAKAQIGFRGIR